MRKWGCYNSLLSECSCERYHRDEGMRVEKSHRGASPSEAVHAERVEREREREKESGFFTKLKRDIAPLCLGEVYMHNEREREREKMQQRCRNRKKEGKHYMREREREREREKDQRWG